MKGRQPQESGSLEHQIHPGRPVTDNLRSTVGDADEVESWDNEGGHDRSSADAQQDKPRLT